MRKLGFRNIALVLALLPLLGAAVARGGVWGDSWGSFLWGPRQQQVPEGLNLYAPTSEIAAGTTSCYLLLEHLGGPGSVDSVERVVTASQQTERCGYAGDLAAGEDFALALGAAYLVNLTQPRDLTAGPPPGCPDTNLAVGVNLVGIGRPPTALNCYDVLGTFGAGTITAIERIDKTVNRFEACSFTAAGIATGANFDIRAGEGYAVYAISPSAGINLNDQTHEVCATP